MNFIESIELKKYKKIIKKRREIKSLFFLKPFNSFMKCDRATSQTQNTRTEKNELPNITCKENTYKTADAGNHSENENHNQIFNNRRVHNLPPIYF